jgi:DNA-binding CsgD family transcriptional regulator
MEAIDTSNELIVCNFDNGIKLLRPDRLNDKRHHYAYSMQRTVYSLLELPLCIYFSDGRSANQNLNELAVEACGFDSLQHAIGKTLHEVVRRDSVKKIIRNDRKVMRARKLHIFEEDTLRKDDVPVHALSIKVPWYDDNDKVIGLLGCSIVLGKQPLAESLMKITKLGILNTSDKNILPGVEINNTYLSKREMECLRLTVRGHPAKHVAYQLGISRRTVEEYLNNIKFKLGVFSKSELIDKTIDCLINNINKQDP